MEQQKKHSSTVHAERAVEGVHYHYEHMNGRTLGDGLGVQLTRSLTGVRRGLKILYDLHL